MVQQLAPITSTITHGPGLPAVQFRRECVGRTCVTVPVANMAIEVEYGINRPSNVCQCCYCLGQVCFNFSPRNDNGEPSHPCDQCRLNKSPGCATLRYHEATQGAISNANRVRVQRVLAGVAPIQYPQWCLDLVLESRASGLPPAQVISIAELLNGMTIVVA
ncbi:hypothetical protein BJV82DRAFT_584497 [Fennellomyces sp. T-0311]|nr:hypothetical protein BJV82DRAFT_584497 [Fennellomyces sp. T-0311]